MINKNQKNIYVYSNISGKDYFVGTIHYGEECSSFEYDEQWIANDYGFPISSELPLKSGVFKTKNTNFYRAIEREHSTYYVDFAYEYLLLYLKKLGLLSPKEDFDENLLYEWLKNANCRSPKFMDNDVPCKDLSLDKCIIYLNDSIRNGSIRFKLDKNGEFVHLFNNIEIPHVTKIHELIQILNKINNKQETLEELEYFCACVAGLGGRQPKVSVKDDDGNLCIAKLTAITDNSKNELLKEVLALRLAKKFGITTQEYVINKIEEKEYLLIKRFDRLGEVRIPFVGLGTYVTDVRFKNDKLISDSIIKLCKKNATKNLREIFKHKLFRIAITDTKVFVPNVGFIYDSKTGWNLAPMFDTTVGFENYRSYNEVKKRLNYETLLTLQDYNTLIKNAHLYRLSHKKVKRMINKLKKIIMNWKEEAIKIGFNDDDLYKIRIYPKSFKKIKYSYRK